MDIFYFTGPCLLLFNRHSKWQAWNVILLHCSCPSAFLTWFRDGYIEIEKLSCCDVSHGSVVLSRDPTSHTPDWKIDCLAPHSKCWFFFMAHRHSKSRVKRWETRMAFYLSVRHYIWSPWSSCWDRGAGVRWYVSSWESESDLKEITRSQVLPLEVYSIWCGQWVKGNTQREQI